MSQQTVQITIRGESGYVNAIAQQMSEFLEITYVSKPQRLAMNKKHIQLKIRAIAMEVPTDDRPDAA